ncbi:hypothetical protein AB996_0714 [Lactococcus cremoris]|uniref:Uncharacterized protein n=1 Tax=Lactococcus lactis subsp. cremoris TaxID=1359 RepID=A0A166JZR8_LACLC|nr:hypothetical protein AB996_0714 [Lactococcus cremoris]
MRFCAQRRFHFIYFHLLQGGRTQFLLLPLYFLLTGFSSVTFKSQKAPK